MLKFSIFLSVLILSMQQAFAACVVPSQSVQKIHFTQHEDCELALDLATTIDQIAKHSSLAPKVTLMIGGVTDNASFDNGHVIQIPYSLKFYGPYGQVYDAPTAHLLAIVAHEYGHAIFLEFLKMHFSSEFGDIFVLLNELSFLREKSGTANNNDLLYKEKKDQLMSNTKFHNFSWLFLPYSEFFADCVAVFISNDKSAILNSLYYDEISNKGFALIKMRDFASDPDPNNLVALTDEHAKLAYVRSFIGKSMWPTSKSQIEPTLNIVLNSILKVTRQNLKNWILRPNYQQANSELIDALNELR